MMNSDSKWPMLESEAAAVIGPGSVTGDSPESALSPYEYLLRALDSHIAAERGSLTQYRELAESSKDPVIELIMEVVLEDEERHHTLLRRIATRLRDDLSWAKSPEALPSADAESPDTTAYESLRSFVESERATAHEMRAFARRAEGLYGGLATELLEMMALDSEKHEHLLRFLFRRVGSTIARA